MRPAEPIRFFLPGPSYVLEETRQALTGPMAAHRSPAIQALYRSISARLPGIFRTAGEVMTATGSSTLIMESALVSTVSPGGAVLSLTNGAFAERWHGIARGIGRSADPLAMPWGEAVDPELVRRALRRRKYEAVTLVHNETSTGVVSPLAEISRVVREESDALLLVDAVSSLAGAPVETDAWGVDVVLAGTQKCFAVPPGLVLFTLSERAAERAARVPHRGFYTDLLRYRDKHREGGPITTPGLPLLYALDSQLERILAEGIEARWARHAELAERTAAWAESRGLAFASAAGARSLTVSCLRPPRDVAPKMLLQKLAERGFTASSGYGDWKPTTFRIGHMGEVRRSDLDDLLLATDEALAELS